MFNTIIKTIIVYFSLMLIVRLMGKRQVGQLQPFDLVIAIIIAEVAATPLDQSGTPLSYGLAPIITLLFFHNLIAFITLKCPKLRIALSGRPSIVIEKGKIDIENLKSMDYTLGELTELLRAKEVFDISTVDYAVIETNGELSVLLKPQENAATLFDLNIEKADTGFSYILIQDGRIDEENIKLLRLTKQKLVHLLKKTDHLHIKHVFCLYVNDYGDVFMQTYKKKTYQLSKAFNIEVNHD
jgi:uncharacterized membrane protein YcaP (DUF421 family)